MPKDQRELDKIRFNKQAEAQRLRKEKSFPSESWEAFKFLVEKTAENPRFKSSYQEIYNFLKELPFGTKTKAKKVNLVVKPLITNLWGFLSEAYDQQNLDVKFRIEQKPGNRGTGVRLKFVPVKRRSRTQPLQQPQQQGQHSINLWRRMIGRPDMQRVLVVYETPCVTQSDLADKKAAKKRDEESEGSGLWAGSGDVAAAFYVASVLFNLDTPVEILRWRDMQHEDVDRKFQCLLIVGNTFHHRLNLIRTRVEWVALRSFQFIEAADEAVSGAIADTRYKEASSSEEIIYEHRSGGAGNQDTDFALVFLYRDTFHDQILFGIQGTTSAATRAATWYMSQNDSAQEVERYLAENDITLTPTSLGFELLLRITLSDGRHKQIKPIDAAVYAP